MYENSGLTDSGKQLMIERAGATKIVEENKTVSPTIPE